MAPNVEAPKSIIHMPKVFYKTHTACVCVQRVISVEGEIILPSIPLHISHSAVSCSSSSSSSSRSSSSRNNCAKSSPDPCDFYSVVIFLSVCSPRNNSCIHPLFLPSSLLPLLFTKVLVIPPPLPLPPWCLL